MFQPPSLQTIDLTYCTNGPRLVLNDEQFLIIKSENLSTTPHIQTEFHFGCENDAQIRFWLRGINHILQFIYDWRI